MFLRVIALFFHLSKYCSMHSLIDIVPPVYYISVYVHTYSASTRAKWWEYKKTNKVQLAFGSGTASGDYDKNIRIPGTCHCGWANTKEAFDRNEIKNNIIRLGLYINFKCYCCNSTTTTTLIASFCSQFYKCWIIALVVEKCKSLWCQLCRAKGY